MNLYVSDYETGIKDMQAGSNHQLSACFSETR